MSFYYSVSFVFRTAPLDAAALAVAEYVMGRRADLPSPLPDHPCFEREPPRFAEPAAPPHPLDVYRHVSMTDLHSYSGPFGHRFVVALEGLPLPDMIHCCLFADWLAQFAEDDGPIGTVFSPDMADKPPQAFFIRRRRLHQSELRCEDQPFLR